MSNPETRPTAADYQSGRWCGECRWRIVEDPACCYGDAWGILPRLSGHELADIYPDFHGDVLTQDEPFTAPVRAHENEDEDEGLS